MIKWILTIVSFLIAGFIYLRYFERSNIYFPTRIIEAAPAHCGLEYEDIFFKTEDGVELNGWFVPAKETKATLIFCHGNGGNISHRLEIIKLFHEMGLNVFIFDYRGYGKSKGRPSEKGTYSDALAAYRFVCSRKNLRKIPVVLYGKSLGAVIAIDLATKADVEALIIDSAFTSVLDMAKELYPFLPSKLISMRYDALSKIASIEIPKLIIHSRDDEIVPFHHGEKLFQTAGEPKEFYLMRGGHNDAMFLSSEEYQARIEIFLSKYIYHLSY